MQKLWFRFWSYLFPARCLGCGRGGESVCVECFNKLRWRAVQVCPGCQQVPTLHGAFCLRCADIPRALDGVLVLASYRLNPLLRRWLTCLKYHNERYLVAELSPLLKQLIQPLSDYTCIPLPLSRYRRWWRGYNVTELLLSDHPYSPLLARWHRSAQAHQAHAQRAQNIAGAFYLRDLSAPVPAQCLLVDDVATTLSTLEAAAQVLKQHGAQRVWGAVVARG